MKLSKNFYLKEFLRNTTAQSLGIPNIPGPGIIFKIQVLVDNILQPLREWYGKPIRIGCGYRSPAVNAALPGAALRSQHMAGEAADIDTVHDNGDLFKWIRDNADFDQLIWEFGDDNSPAWIHVSYKPGGPNRNQVLRAFSVSGRSRRYELI